MIFIVNLEVPSQNVRERWHWRKQRREVSQWEFNFRSLSVPGQWATGKRSVHIHAFRKQRTKDEANLIGGCKGLCDGLVRSKLLLDDSRDLATFTYSEEVASKSPSKKPCTVITINEVST